METEIISIMRREVLERTQRTWNGWDCTTRECGYNGTYGGVHLVDTQICTVHKTLLLLLQACADRVRTLQFRDSKQRSNLAASGTNYYQALTTRVSSYELLAFLLLGVCFPSTLHGPTTALSTRMAFRTPNEMQLSACTSKRHQGW